VPEDIAAAVRDKRRHDDFQTAFKKSRWVKYRYMTGGNVGFRSDGKLIICEEGNETSED
jgi:hypothetical protein